jgi:D-glycero-beta-D-manno-heptose-7-phosphate kinase
MKKQRAKQVSRQVTRERLEEILTGIAGRRVLVIGDVGVDRYTIGSVERISPEAPVPIVFVEEELNKLGLAANVADNVKALGGIPLLTGIVGRDRAAEDFRALLVKAGVGGSHLVVDPMRRTVLKERIVSERQQLLRVDYETAGAVSAKAEKALIAKIGKLAGACDAIILEDYAKGLLNEKVAGAVFSAAKRHGRIVAVDPNAKTGISLYRGSTVLTPNTKEAEKLSRISIVDTPSLLEAGRRILKATSARHVVITRGKDGMAIFSAGISEASFIPTYAREVYDVSGAGDTVISVLTLALSAGASIEEAAILGNLAAGVEVGKRGTATVSPDEIRLAMEFFSAVGI